MASGIKETKIYPLVKEIKETSDIKEAAKLLNSGNWIAIFATPENADGSVTICLARI